MFLFNFSVANLFFFNYLEPVPAMPMAAFQIYDDLSDAWSQEDDEISDHYLHLRLSLKVVIANIFFVECMVNVFKCI